MSVKKIIKGIIMALSEKKKLEWEKTLRELGLMTETDTIEENVSGDYWEKVLLTKSQIRGNFFFTKEKFIFVSAFGMNNLSFLYSEIKDLKKCMISVFIPTGIKITAFDKESGKEKDYTISVLKRAQRIAQLSEKAGL